MAKLGIAQRIAKNADSSRSPLYVWLRENHDEITDAISGPRPLWSALAKTAVEAGKKDAKGKNPTPNACRSAWLRVTRDIAASGTKPKLTPSSPVGVAPSKPLPLPTQLPDEDDPPPKYTWTPTKLK